MKNKNIMKIKPEEFQELKKLAELKEKMLVSIRKYYDPDLEASEIALKVVKELGIHDREEQTFLADVYVGYIQDLQTPCYDFDEFFEDL